MSPPRRPELRRLTWGVFEAFSAPFMHTRSCVEERCLPTCWGNLLDTNYVGITAVLGPAMVTPFRAGSGSNRGICRSVGGKLK